MFTPIGPERPGWGVSSLTRDEMKTIFAKARQTVERALRIQKERPLVTNWGQVKQGLPPKFKR